MTGAVVKTRNIYEGLLSEYGSSVVSYVDIWGGKKRALCILNDIARAFKDSLNVILISSATNGAIIDEISVLQKIYRRNLIYIPIGIKIGKRVLNDKNAQRKLKCVNTFLPECNENCFDLRCAGFSQVELLRNFKALDIEKIPIEGLDADKKVYTFCTFSRVTKDKGISDAIKAIQMAQQWTYPIHLHLNIYGMIDDSYRNELDTLLNQNHNCVYNGCVNSSEDVATLQQNDFVLFPTRYPDEGIPGTIIDSFAAGTTIISSKWDYFDEILQDGVTALGYEFLNQADLANKMVYAVTHIDEMNDMRRNARAEYEKYDVKNVLPILVRHLV